MSYEEFRRRIDTMRQILVGAVPSPAGQIDQITYALMYKFMNDIDDQSAALGGVRTYFTGEYEKYNWHALMSSSLGAHERLELYRQAIQTMAKNENIPELFRSIYQNAFLPFNSANVLTLFLKEADKFSHGEADDIGDAYEYLLSITGAQGDVGQFRTPRHIIKFIAEAVNPTKDDKVLDPAVGTAGFLIAAYNHVRSQHDGKDKDGSVNNEKRLTADELDKIHRNYRGFDIDPTMVRTAKVNMYLHGFKTPDIINHDSLSSEEYWNDRYDVILANPPFMTPKGGIQPHKKFSINASRAEVLFVDYILDHLKPTGRAGFIVPSSVSINDNAKYYSNIRKKLVETGLTAVIELHDSVFKPYAEVTTHIYMINKDVKKLDRIPFIKVNNDGYDKSDLRKPIEGSELSDILDFLKNGSQKNNLNISYIDTDEFWASDKFYLAPKLNSKDVLGHSDGVALGEIIEECKERLKDSDGTILSVSNKAGFVIAEDYFKKRVASTDLSNYKVIKKDYFAFNPSRINVGSIAYNNSFEHGTVSPMYQVFKIKDLNRVNPDYLISVLKSQTFLNIIGANIKGSTRKVIKIDKLKQIKIPIPSLSDQLDIIAELAIHKQIIEKKSLEIIDEENKIKSRIAEVWGE